MTRYRAKILLVLFFLALFSFAWKEKTLAEVPLSQKLKGRILLQIESRGEAWYVNPADQYRYFLGSPKDGFDLMRNLALGISNQDLGKIALAEENIGGPDEDNDGLADNLETSLGTDGKKSDTDGDGYGDKQEILNGYNPLDQNKLSYDKKLAARLAGSIVLQTEKNGEAWYINPVDSKKYYLGRPADAFNLMRRLGLGITNQNLLRISQVIIKPDYMPENIKDKFTVPIANSNLRQYGDTDKSYSFAYPADWKIKKFEQSPNSVQLTDAVVDFINEKRAVITIDFLKTENDETPDIFRLAAKGDVKAATDSAKKINEFSCYENSYEYKLAYEKTTTVKIKPKQFLRISLITAKHDNGRYLKIYEDLLKSLTAK